ncbi:universal stress protein [Singulisphaera sp. PoT]|uniref:universal stress protein n=1 Tax=Singulisphaera sp. PoT TaxID=3411797 RepID=UPI003BF54421
MLPIRTILHPTDFSEAANNAYQLARMIARDCDAKVIVLHVVGIELDLPHPIDTELGLAFDCSQDEHSRHAAWLKRLHEDFDGDPELRLETRLLYGDAATEIVREAAKISCDLIVMGTHGRSGVIRALMGSVAESVVRHSCCPVLTVKTPLSDPADERIKVSHEATSG